MRSGRVMCQGLGLTLPCNDLDGTAISYLHRCSGALDGWVSQVTRGQLELRLALMNARATAKRQDRSFPPLTYPASRRRLACLARLS